MEIELNEKEIYNIWKTLIVANIKKEKQEFFNTYKTEINTYRDIGFTEKEMKKKGECFKC